MTTQNWLSARFLAPPPVTRLPLLVKPLAASVFCFFLGVGLSTLGLNRWLLFGSKAFLMAAHGLIVLAPVPALLTLKVTDGQVKS